MDRTTRRKYWLSHIDGWRSSGLSQSAYCREQGLALGTFHYWKRQSERVNSEAPTCGGALNLVEVNLAPSADNAQMRLRWDDGPTVELGVGFSPFALREVIEAVRNVYDYP